MTQTIATSNLHASMLQFFQEIEANGSEIIITKQDIPILKIVPIKPKTQIDQLFASWRKKASFDKAAAESSTVDEWNDLQ